MGLPAAEAIPISDRTTDLQVISGLALITGWSFIEMTGAATAQVNLYDGTSANGALIAAISLIANESTRDLIPAPFVAAMSGVYLEVLTGEIMGSLWTIPATLENGYAFADGAKGVWTGDV